MMKRVTQFLGMRIFGKDHTPSSIKNHLYTSLYWQIISTYKRRFIVWVVVITTIVTAIASPIASFRHGLSWNNVYFYNIWLVDMICMAATAAAAGVSLQLVGSAYKEGERIGVGVAYLIRSNPNTACITTIKAVATAGSGAGQTRTIPAAFLLGAALSLFGKSLIAYAITPTPLETYESSIGYMLMIFAIITILVDIQKASIDTDILKAIAYYEEYLAEETSNPAPAPIQPAAAPTPAPTVAKTTNHRQQPQPQQAPQGQPQRKKKRS